HREQILENSAYEPRARFRDAKLQLARVAQRVVALDVRAILGGQSGYPRLSRQNLSIRAPRIPVVDHEIQCVATALERVRNGREYVPIVSVQPALRKNANT